MYFLFLILVLTCVRNNSCDNSKGIRLLAWFFACNTITMLRQLFLYQFDFIYEKSNERACFLFYITMDSYKKNVYPKYNLIYDIHLYLPKTSQFILQQTTYKRHRNFEFSHTTYHNEAICAMWIFLVILSYCLRIRCSDICQKFVTAILKSFLIS